MSVEGWNSVSSQDLNSWFNPQRDLVIQRFETDDWDETREDESIYKLEDWMNEMDGVNGITGMSMKDMDELKKDLLVRPMFNNAIDITTSTTTSTGRRYQNIDYLPPPSIKCLCSALITNRLSLLVDFPD